MQMVITNLRLTMKEKKKTIRRCENVQLADFSSLLQLRYHQCNPVLSAGLVTGVNMAW